MIHGLVLAMALGAAPQEAANSADSSEEFAWSSAKRKIRADPKPESITRGLHYVVSDEQRHDLFKDDIEGLGGVFLGVGTNQNYLMAGWAKPEHLVIIDFDDVIIDIHEMYRIFFTNAETPEAFMDFWKRPWSYRKVAQRAINKNIRYREQRKRVRAAYIQYRRRINHALNSNMKLLEKYEVSSFLTDQEQYDYVRNLFLNDRVFYIRGDFTGPRTLRDIAKILKTIDQPIRVMYLSNIEQYIGYGRGRFRKNLLDLPIDEKSVVLRAYGFGRTRTADDDGNYRYFVQNAENFHLWLQDRRWTYVTRMLASEQPTDTKGYYRLTLTPEQYVAQRREQKERGKSRKKADGKTVRGTTTTQQPERVAQNVP